VGEVYFHHF